MTSDIFTIGLFFVLLILILAFPVVVVLITCYIDGYTERRALKRLEKKIEGEDRIA